MAVKAESIQNGVMFLVVVGATLAFVFLMIVAAGLLKAAGLQEPTPEADEVEEPRRKSA